MQLNKVQIDKILFLDIETVPEVYRFGDLDETTAKLYLDKNRFTIERDKLSPEQAYEKAGVFAEFSKIICISCGFVQQSGKQRKIRIKSFAGDDEKILLSDFVNMLESHFSHSDSILCGHNAKEFDFPFIARRLLLNRIDIPRVLDIAGKKPWEIAHLDTMELWKFGDYKHYTSLNLLCHIFKIPSPKADISGADVARVYYEENGLERITAYCQNDVVACIRLFLRFRNEDLVSDENVILSN
jgi:DNA polymerase elongation subunit (family B)